MASTEAVAVFPGSPAGEVRDAELRELLVAELRIAHLRAKSAQMEIEFLGRALRQNILTVGEIVEALEVDLGWSGFLEPTLMAKIRSRMDFETVA